MLRAVRTRRALVLVGVISAADAFALVALIASLLSRHEKSGGELLLKGATIWGTNMVTFGLLFWEFVRGGPARRREPDPPPRDFQFPQDENPTLAEPGWHPRLADYVYVSFTNAVAFSPTDVMPLSRRVKMMMLVEAAVEGRGIRRIRRRGEGRRRPISSFSGPFTIADVKVSASTPCSAARSSKRRRDRRQNQPQLRVVRRPTETYE